MHTQCARNAQRSTKKCAEDAHDFSVHRAHNAIMSVIQSDWLKARKKELRVSDEAIGEAIGIERSVVNKIISGKVEFNHRYADGFARALKMTREDVLFRFGVLDEGPAYQSHAIPEGAMPVMPIPLLGDVPGGPWQEAIRTAHHFIPAPQAGMPPSAYALKVVGNSMDKVAKDGAVVVLDPNDLDLFDTWFYVVRNPDQEVTFKQYRENPARLVPCSTDPSHQIIPIREKGYEVVARVLKIIIDPTQAALD